MRGGSQVASFDTRFALLRMTNTKARHPEQARRAVSKDARRVATERRPA